MLRVLLKQYILLRIYILGQYCTSYFFGDKRRPTRNQCPRNKRKILRRSEEGEKGRYLP
jgi:hypothetical protein